jgi:hypothetical protein
MRTIVGLAALLALPLAARGGEAAELKNLEDNSFLLEEAYNQEEGVVQNIATFQRDRRTGDWVGTFTQEWPAPGQEHQLSYTLALARVGGPDAAAAGPGDAAVHYRYQAVGAEGPVAVSPRASLLVPAGDARRGLGAGGAGLDLGIPLSLRFGTWLATHSNLSASWIPRARGPSGRGPMRGIALGQSAVLFPHPRLNLLVEALWTRTELASSAGGRRIDELTLSPGIRAGMDLSGGLQVVGGLAAPLGLGPSRGSRAVLGYLSLELPFVRR